MAKITITLNNRTDATQTYLLSLGLSPSLVELVKETHIEFGTEDLPLFQVEDLNNNIAATEPKINKLKKK